MANNIRQEIYIHQIFNGNQVIDATLKENVILNSSTTDRPTPNQGEKKGLIHYDSDINRMIVWNGNQWKSISYLDDSSSGGGSQSLSDTLVLGNQTDGNDLIIDSGDTLDINGTVDFTGATITGLTTPSSITGGSGNQEWQDSVKGYLITVGTDTVVNGLTSTNDQINYLDNNYENFYIKTTTVSGNSYSVSDNTWYHWDGSTFSVDNPVTTDDNNRYLKIENDITLDTTYIIGTGSSYSLNLNDTVSNNNIIEYLGTSSTGLSQSAWFVTTPRVGMVTTLDDISNRRTRYTGSSNGWIEALDEKTFKVNSQKNITCNLTEEDYDVAIDELLQFEPSGDKSVDILINGLEVINDSYDFAQPSSMVNISTYSINGTNSLQIPNSESPTLSEYLRFNNGSTYNYRKVSGITSSATFSTVTYNGDDVTTITSLDKFSATPRNGIAKKDDILLWIGSNLYELDNDDLMTLEYITADRSAENL